MSPQPARTLPEDGAREGKYLTFALDAEEYGIGICKVKEIIGMIPIRPVPQTPPQVKGVINLRGKVIPVVDLRLRFAMPPLEYSDRTCIVVVEVPGENGPNTMGVVVDAVSEVLPIKPQDIEDCPDFGIAAVDMQFITGIAKIGGSVKILMDIERVLGAEAL
ncbi:MAG: chemotaxis protein CheW [Deltaproteobacteria bacterium]|nr:chemotaxis protein CheW [Deltaproteobacteria bacterium]